MTAVDYKARDPPGPWIFREHLCQSPVATHPRKVRTRSDPGPPDRLIADIRNQTRRNRGLGDLPSQRVAIVRCRFRRRGWLISLADKELTPAPRRILTTSAERPDKITPTIRGGRPYLYGHGPDPTVLASSRQPNFSGAVAGPPQRWQPAPCAPEWPDMYSGLTRSRSPSYRAERRIWLLNRSRPRPRSVTRSAR